MMFHFLISAFIMVNLMCTQETKVDYKTVLHTFNKAWNTGEYDLLDQVVHPEYFKQEGDMQIIGIEPLKEYIKNWRNSLPDAKIVYIDEVYGDEKAAILFTLEGTPVESGKKFKSEGIVIFQFKGGKIIEDKSVFDQLRSLTQQGYTLSPPAKQ
jgi:ketosteroid isomerase-like protein